MTLLGIDLALLIGNTVVTETVFNGPGLGVDSASGRPAGGARGGGARVLRGRPPGLIADIVYAYLDPRVRYR